MLILAASAVLREGIESVIFLAGGSVGFSVFVCVCGAGGGGEVCPRQRIDLRVPRVAGGGGVRGWLWGGAGGGGGGALGGLGVSTCGRGVVLCEDIESVIFLAGGWV